jgi:hypothetical protein
MDPGSCACSFFILALLRTKLHFGLLHLLSVFFGPASTIPWRAVGRRSDRRRQRFNASRNRLLSRRDRHKNSVTDPRESDQGQKKREKKNCLVKIVRQPKHVEHEAQRGDVQDKSEQRRIGPGPGDKPEHEQNKKENRGQGQAPNYLEKKISRDLERITSGESMLEKKRRRAGNQVGRRKQQRRDVNETIHL